MSSASGYSGMSLAERGIRRIEWAERLMPVCTSIAKEFRRERPLEGVRVGCCLHVTKETAVLVRVLLEGGASVALCPSNPLSTQDDVAAALSSLGVSVYAFRGMSVREYYEAIGRVLSQKPHITVDDGADLTVTVHKILRGVRDEAVSMVQGVISDPAESCKGIFGGTEETTTGVMRLRSLEEQGLLFYPVIAVNDSPTKRLFDNPIGTGQSVFDGIMRATGVLLAGKKVVVAGYGQVGSGIAARARGLGCDVIVVEPSPVRALMAAMNGFRVTDMSEAASIGDIFITATGNINVIRKEHFEKMKNNALLANAGHYDVEISKKDLATLSNRVENVSDLVTKYVLRDGRELYLLAEGRLVNLVAAEGHPPEVMDLSFSLQALAVRYLVENRGKLGRRVHVLPSAIDERVALEKLNSMGIRLEQLTPEQLAYLREWQLGTS
ncbi:MAG: adenosylhomocysteinase [Nitrososphaerota archaeon]